MKKLITILLLSSTAFGQPKRDSLKTVTLSGDGPHNGTCCGHWEQTYTLIWSRKLKVWSMFSDSLYRKDAPTIKQNK